MKTNTEVIDGLLMTTSAAGRVTATNDDVDAVYMLPKTWNESHFPYPGDLTPKPTWEIIVKVRHRFSL